jgi:hypothetical protein
MSNRVNSLRTVIKIAAHAGCTVNISHWTGCTVNITDHGLFSPLFGVNCYSRWHHLKPFSAFIQLLPLSEPSICLLMGQDGLRRNVQLQWTSLLILPHRLMPDGLPHWPLLLIVPEHVAPNRRSRTGTLAREFFAPFLPEPTSRKDRAILRPILVSGYLQT